jgi:pyruvate dehydrogenase E2 component (dihydrolipoamide acetyltransferase)
MEVAMDAAASARESLADETGVKVSFNDLIIKACALALRRHPAVNASWLETKFRYNKHIHIGMAVAVDEGLIVPVIKFADGKSVQQIAAESRQLAEKARNKQLQPEEYTGNTFTISNLGMMDIEEFTAIINPPDACIMAVGRVKETPVVRNGAVTIGRVMKVTLSCDHRIVDGATGARFLQTFKQLLEEPVRMFI